MRTPGTNVGPVQITPSQSNKNVSNLSSRAAYCPAVASRWEVRVISPGAWLDRYQGRETLNGRRMCVQIMQQARQHKSP